jgi:hypothetical protein
LRPETALRLPYPGLRSFRREEADLFFGREDCVNGMVDRLAATRFLAVLGSSGTGKSSVVKTGLLDALDLGLMAPAGSTWRVVEVKPGSAPLKNIALALLLARSEGAAAATQVSENDADLLRAFLLRGPLSVAEWCADGHLPADTNLLLLVDQFEELFRYQNYAGREEAEAFAALLLESARQGKLPIYVTLTMRSEYLGACALIEGLAEAISAGLVLIPRMTREQCRSAIVGPAAVCGFKIADDLTNRLLNDLAAFAPWDDRSTRDQLDRLARRADQLPLLQYCLNRMWTRARDAASAEPIMLTLADYERIGGLGGALNAHADEVLRNLGADCRTVAEAVFRALTEGSSAGEAVRRPTRFDELVAICNGDEARVRKVVDAFRAPGCNFLAPGLDPANPRPLAADTVIDVSHESLIRQWKQLSEWVEAEGRSRRQWQRLKDRFEDKQPLQGAELANMQAWRDEQAPNAAWARRYGGDFSATMEFIERSERRQRKFAPLVLPAFGLAALFVSALLMIGITNFILPIPVDPYGDLAFIALAAAVTCGFGVWRYAGIGLRRVSLAGTFIFILLFALCGPLIIALLQMHFRADDVFYWSNVLAAPILAAALVISTPRFRSLFVWMCLTGTLDIGMRILYPFPEYYYYYPIVWCVFFAVLGSLLRWTGDPVHNPIRQRALAAFQLAVLAWTTFIAVVTWKDAIFVVALHRAQPSWWWYVDLGLYPTAFALALAFGLRHFRALQLRTSLLAGAVIVVLAYILGAASLALLSSHGMPHLRAYHWTIAIFDAPIALLALAIFEKRFRNVPLLLMFAALFFIPYWILSWLLDSGVIFLPVALNVVLVPLVAALWAGAIGYWLSGIADPRGDEATRISPVDQPNPELARASP